MINKYRLKISQKVWTVAWLAVFSFIWISCDKKQEMQKAQTIEDVPVMQTENEIPDSLKRIQKPLKDSTQSADTAK